MRTKLILNVAFLSLVLTGCNTTYYYSEFIQPSQTYIPAKIYAVGVLNRGASPEMTTPIYTDGVLYEYIKGIPQKAGDKTIDALKKDMDVLQRFKLIDIPWKGDMRDPRKFSEEPLTSAEIDSLCDAYQVGGIVALEGVDMTIRTQGDVNVITVNDELGMPMRIPEFSNRQEVSFTVAWRFYDGYSLSAIDTYQETYQRIFNRVAYTPTEAGQINPQEMQLMDVALEAARDYYERVSPYWKEGFRLYYRGGSTELYNISQNLEYNDDWKEAAAAWLTLTRSDDEKVKRFAMFNMAVASEMLGSPKVAKEWLLKSMDIKKTKNTEKYLETINRQIVVYDVVDKQLGI